MTVEGPYPTHDPRQVSLTAAVLAGGAGTMFGLADVSTSSSGSTLAVLLGVIGLVAAVYEVAAIYTDDFPTITEHLTRNGWIVRVIAIVVPVLAWVDHIGPGWVL